MDERKIERGDIWWLDWHPGRGSEQIGIRPSLIVQNDVGNEYARTTIVAAITTRGQSNYPFIIAVTPGESGLRYLSYVNVAQLMTVDKGRLFERVGRLNAGKMTAVDAALGSSLGLRR